MKYVGTFRGGFFFAGARAILMPSSFSLGPSE